MKSMGWSRLWLLAGALLLALPVGMAWAEGEGDKAANPDKPKGGRGGNIGQILTLEKIEERLEAKLTDEQKTKITALREELTKKIAELDAKEDVKAAKEALKNAKDDAEARKAAQAKLKEATGGFNAYEDYKKGLGGILSAEQVAKIFPAGGRKRPGEGRAEEKKSPEHKEEAKKPDEAPGDMK